MSADVTRLDIARIEKFERILEELDAKLKQTIKEIETHGAALGEVIAALEDNLDGIDDYTGTVSDAIKKLRQIHKDLMG